MNQGRRIRVLLVGPSLRILGGQAVQAARLLDRLRAEHNIEADFLPVNPVLPGPLAALQKLKFVRTVVTSAAYWLELLFRVPRYDVIHAFSASYWSFLLAPVPAVLAARLYGKSALLNYRSGEAEDHLANWRTACMFVRLFDRIVVPSQYLVDVFAKFDFPAEPVFNFVDLSLFRFRPRRNLNPVFLSNRNFHPMYNVSCVLRAFAIVQARYPEARLIVAGDGEQRDQLRQLASELHLQNVEWIGRIPNAKMIGLYDAADIYLNAPDIDNMPGSIIEAYASGIPVVTTDAGGIPYIVEHGRTGLMVSRDDHAAMAAQCLRLLEDPELAAELSAEAHRRCVVAYTWDAVRDEWLRIYQEMAAHRASAVLS